jgi:hypothetical protein
MTKKTEISREPNGLAIKSVGAGTVDPQSIAGAMGGQGPAAMMGAAGGGRGPVGRGCGRGKGLARAAGCRSEMAKMGDRLGV